MKKANALAAPGLALVLACLSATSVAQESVPGSPAATASDVRSVDLPVSRVVLYTSGIGYFEHHGTVEGTVEVDLPVNSEHMDDLLQSLVLQDLDGGSIRPVRYAARDPLDRLLGSYSLDLTGDPTFAELLSQARGESVLVTTSQSHEGTIVNIEQVTVPEDEPITYLTLATAVGLQRIDLSEVRSLQFQRPELQQQLSDALAALAYQRNDDEGNVRLLFSGTGSRRVNVGYVREMPVWKTSYRLLIGEEGEATLQGWAIFDNPTSLDLEDIAVSFVAGQPISFVSSLYEPVYVERPRVAATMARNIVSPVYGADSPSAPARMEADLAAEMEAEMAAAAMRSEASRSVRAAPRQDATGVAAMAAGSQTGATFEYRVEEPVSVARYQSAMIPIVHQRIEARPLSIYDHSVLPGHPLRAVRLVNDTELHLAAGPLSVFDQGVFAGNSQITDTVPGDSRALAYAVDLGVEFQVTSTSEPERVKAVTFRNGVIETSVRQRLRSEYRATPRGDEERFIVVEHPKHSGFEVVSPEQPPAETARSYRFGISFTDAAGNRDVEQADTIIPTHQTCDAGASCTLLVTMERTESRSLAVSNVSSDQIAFYLENVELSEEDREKLSRILELKERLAQVERSLAARQANLDAIHRDQERVRQNMAALDRNSSLYRRYSADLEEQEGELDEIADEIEELRETRAEVREELDRAVAAP